MSPSLRLQSEALHSRSSGAKTRCSSNPRMTTWRRISSSGRHPGGSTTNWIRRVLCRKWCSPLTSLPLRQWHRKSANKAGPPKLVSPADVLIGTKAIRMFGAVSDKKRVAVYLRDIYEHDGQLFIRYSISNETERAYTPGIPQVVALNSPRYHQSLYALAHFQLSPREAERVKARGEAPVTVAGAEIESSRIDPGQETTGIVAIKLPETRVHPAVIRLTFLAAPAGPVNALLVL